MTGIRGKANIFHSTNAGIQGSVITCIIKVENVYIINIIKAF